MNTKKNIDPQILIDGYKTSDEMTKHDMYEELVHDCAILDAQNATLSSEVERLRAANIRAGQALVAAAEFAETIHGGMWHYKTFRDMVAALDAYDAEQKVQNAQKAGGDE
jgi:hypothetical protein